MISSDESWWEKILCALSDGYFGARSSDVVALVYCHENRWVHVIAWNVIADMLQQMQLFANWDLNFPVWLSD